ncbi:MAG: hypothetical protein KA801_12465 [Syntrophorhabdaceae bacterium]|nr:hypothetical protein [Syntrophorhabdaceae bacterium]
MNIKRIVAREGLIILGAITAVVLSFLITDHLRIKSSEYKRTATVYEILDADPSSKKLNSKNGEKIEIGHWSRLTNIFIMVPGIYHNEQYLTNLSRKYFPDVKNPEFEKRDAISKESYAMSDPVIIKYYNFDGTEKSINDLRMLFYICLALYPAYLLSRFIWWAIRTLRA